MSEVALRLGSEQHLVGVLTPATGTPRPLGILIFNAGVIHRIGPGRLSVRIARHLAQHGYNVVRFDLSGLGDSRAPRAAASHREQAIQDARAVMDYLEKAHGLTAFALWGICAGAEHAYGAAQRDERVAGLFMLDGYAYPSLKGLAIHYTARLRALTLAKIGRRLRRALSGAAIQVDRAAPAEGEAPLSRPTRERFAADIAKLVARGVRVVMLFSANADYWYPEQMHDAFRRYRFMKHVVCHHAPAIDHLVTLRPAKERVLALVDEWVSTMDPR